MTGTARGSTGTTAGTKASFGWDAYGYTICCGGISQPLRSLVVCRFTGKGRRWPSPSASKNNCRGERGQYSAAMPLVQRSLAIWEQALGPEHPNVSESLNNLA